MPNAKMIWDHVRIETNATDVEYADLVLMDNERVAARIIHLQLHGPVSRTTVMAQPDWQIMLDALAVLSTPRGQTPWLPVTAGDDVWLHEVPKETVKQNTVG